MGQRPLHTDDYDQFYTTGDLAMLSTIIIILLVLWVLGAFVVPVGGSLIHLLLVIAVAVVLIRIIQGRSPISG